MKTSHYALVLLACASACAAKDHPDYQNGKILQMESTSCGLQEKGSKTVAGEIFGACSDLLGHMFGYALSLTRFAGTCISRLFCAHG